MGGTRGFLNTGAGLIVLVLAGGLTSLEGAERTSLPLLRKLDAHYYYPQRRGLKKLEMRVQWARLDRGGNPAHQTYLNNPPAVFTWNEDLPEGRFEMDPSDGPVSPVRELEIIRHLSNYREMFLPVPLEDKLGGYKLASYRVRDEFIEAGLIAGPPSAILRYDLKIDPSKWIIERVHTQRARPPFHVESRLRYVPRGEFWQVAESRSRFSTGGKTYEERIEFVHRFIEGFWLPVRIRQELREEGHLAQVHLFQVRHHRIN